ncbi:MAG: hypothetical protein JXA11_09470 [Phycisphaerae bacterium]|nr:hypothetical protein [Phycisphaerae bacterium]
MFFQMWVCLEEFFTGRDDPQKEESEAIDFLKDCAAAAPCSPQKPFTTFND